MIKYINIWLTKENKGRSYKGYSTNIKILRLWNDLWGSLEYISLIKNYNKKT